MFRVTQPVIGMIYVLSYTPGYWHDLCFELYSRLLARFMFRVKQPAIGMIYVSSYTAGYCMSMPLLLLHLDLSDLHTMYVYCLIALLFNCRQHEPKIQSVRVDRDLGAGFESL